MRVHALSYKFVAMALVSALLLPATIVSAHPAPAAEVARNDADHGVRRESGG